MKAALIIGHNENSPGAMNQDKNVSEFDFNEPLAHAIAKALLNLGYEVSLVYRDGSYSELPDQVNKTGADIAISLHCNAFNKGSNGSEVLYYKGSENGLKLALSLQTEIVDCLDLKDRGVKETQAAHEGKAGDRGGYLLKHTSMPCVIAEPFFIDSNESLDLAVSKFDDLVAAYKQGIVNYFDKNK